MRTISAVAVFALAGLVTLGASQDRKTESEKGHDMKLSGNIPQDMKMMNEMMVKHLGKKDPDYEKRFIDMMIPHHEGAILMAKHALKNANRPELKEMAEKVITDQQKEIEQLKKWRQEWYGQK